jgi:hypothetical protein
LIASATAPTTSALSARSPRQRLGREIERQHALAAFLHEIAADRLAHYAKADEADSPVHSHILLWFLDAFP